MPASSTSRWKRGDDVLLRTEASFSVGHRPKRPKCTGLVLRRSFQRLVKWRTGSEGRISCLKRDFGWARTRIDGLHGAKTLTWCGHGVFNHNLVKIAALIG